MHIFRIPGRNEWSTRQIRTTLNRPLIISSTQVLTVRLWCFERYATINSRVRISERILKAGEMENAAMRV
ncbi:hypothetical protein GJ744_007729 [Endocarpon pusillum]|uniref:Uncharacterized protein n=1 Tax=Endocarpon pusillum TaxID=364733 RepID=A0A8H7AR25_9EURO|nr:hypothetical protein GJ744_007729 [Endocarpon pusillum]